VEAGTATTGSAPTVDSLGLSEVETDDGDAEFNSDYDEPNPDALQVTDAKARYAWENGFVHWLQPMWGDEFDNSTAQERKWWVRHWIARFHAFNTVFSVTGEYMTASSCCSQQREMGQYIDSVDGLDHLTTIHPGTTQDTVSSLEDFEGDNWLDFHSEQTWDEADEFNLLETDYAADDGPVLNVEAGYDGEFGHERLDVRRDMYQVMFSGLGAGYTYGVSGIAFDYEGLSTLDKESSFDLQRMVTTIESEIGESNWETLTNDQGIIESANGRPIATYLSDSTREFVYFETAKDATVGLSHIDASEADLTWYRPSDGSTESIGTFGTSDSVSVTPPSWEDALLIARPA